MYSVLSEEFIERYIDKIDWFSVSMYQYLSEEFIDKYSDCVYWKEISQYQNISYDFIQTYWEKINFDVLFYNRKIDENIIVVNFELFYNEIENYKIDIGLIRPELRKYFDEKM